MASEPPPEDSYLFSRNEKSSIRLNYHHWVTKQVCGYLIHPKIPTKKENLRVVDVGAGTGIWALEILDDLPACASATLFDISPAQYPLSLFMPKNLHLRTHNAFLPFPLEHRAKYDIVSIRFFLTLTNSKNVEALIDNLVSLLKPGGYLQWLEFDIYSSKAVAAIPETPMPAVEKLVSMMKQPHPDAEYNWVLNLDSIFSKYGLETIGKDRIYMLDKHKPFLSHVHLLTLEDLCVKMEGSGMTEQAKAGWEMAERLKDEFRQGASVITDYIITIGRKSL